MMPTIISSAENSLINPAGSLKNKMPIVNVPIAPIPVHTA